MRDLAQQNFSGKSYTRSTIFRVLAIIVVVAGLIFILKSKFGGSASGNLSVILQNAPNGLKPVNFSGSDVAKSGIDLKGSSVTFRNVSGDSASATASRTFGDGSFSLSVTATLSDPKGGDKYQVWLVGANGVFDAGLMEGSKNTWSLVFRDKDKYSSAYNQIWITREITTNDNRPEKHILEGSF